MVTWDTKQFPIHFIPWLIRWEMLTFTKQTPPSTLALFSLPTLLRGTEELVFLIPGGIHLHPISICCTGVCTALVSFLLKLYFVNFPSPPSQGVGPCKVLKLEKFCFLYTCFLFPAAAPLHTQHTHLDQLPRVAAFQSTPNWVT